MSKKHNWEMVNIRAGYIIYENSYPNRMTRCYFSEEDVEPIEEYKEGDEFWKFAGSAQSIKFDMRCKNTAVTVKFDELLGIMYPDSQKCKGDIAIIQTIAEEFQIYIYVALCYRGPKGEVIELSTEQLHVLNEYFNAKLRTPGKKILILPEKLCGPPEMCFGSILVDTGMTSFE